jgi:predicted glutamine amidotransferase
LLDSISEDLLKLRTGDTDSELFFLYLLTQINELGFVPGVVKGIQDIKGSFKYSSINSMILNSEFFIVISEHDPVNKPDWADDVYYELRYRLDVNGFAVASSGWNQEGWQLLNNHEILIVNRETLKTEIVKL